MILPLRDVTKNGCEGRNPNRYPSYCYLRKPENLSDSECWPTFILKIKVDVCFFENSRCLLVMSARFLNGASPDGTLIYSKTLPCNILLILYLFLINQSSRSVIPILLLLYLITNPNYKRNTKAKYWFYSLLLSSRVSANRWNNDVSWPIVWYFKGTSVSGQFRETGKVKLDSKALPVSDHFTANSVSCVLV